MLSINRIFTIVLFLSLAIPGLTLARYMQGWEEEGAYNQLYNAAELDRIKCKVIKITEVVPMNGMSPGVALIVDDGDGEKIEVHLGPKWFLGDSIGIKKGDELKIRGSWAEIGGKDVFMASKVKKGDFFSLKVRLTKNGKPFWTMTPEELEKEREEE
ncbi:MAG: hypothetical protein SCH71_00270 [Desulfobulbaceae bacterium]|nr:hypothetical protein [Desulfobulbaceae bacterium]